MQSRPKLSRLKSSSDVVDSEEATDRRRIAPLLYHGTWYITAKTRVRVLPYVDCTGTGDWWDSPDAFEDRVLLKLQH